MAVADDLSRIAFLAVKGIRITNAATANTLLVDPPGDTEGETLVTLTAAQKLAIFNRRAAVIAEIKTLAAALPSA
jgi:hypothetical protein